MGESVCPAVRSVIECWRLFGERVYRGRVGRLAGYVSGVGADCIVVFSCYGDRDGNAVYLTGFRSGFPPGMDDADVRGLGCSAVVVSQSGEVTLVSPLQSFKTCNGYFDRLICGRDLVKALLSLLAGMGVRRVLLEGLDVIPSMYVDALKNSMLGVEFVKTGVVAEMRVSKSPEEVDMLRRAAAVGDKVLEECPNLMREGMREKELAAELTKLAYETGADYVIRTRVACGERATYLTYPFAGERKITKEELVAVDVIGWVGDYAFDLLRTYTLSKRKELLKVIEKAAEATDDMINNLKPDVVIDSLCRNLEDKLSDKNYEVTAFGHGIGVEVVEKPLLVRDNPAKLHVNTTLCVEPRAAMGGKAAQVEDTVVVTETGAELLSKAPRVFR